MTDVTALIDGTGSAPQWASHWRRASAMGSKFSSRPRSLSQPSAGERGELAIEALGRLEVRRVPDAVVPGDRGARADLQHVLGHRRQHDRVGAAVGDEQRDVERAQYVVVVDL